MLQKIRIREYYFYLNQKIDIIVSLDKDRFRNDLGGLIEAYSEIHRRINDFLKPN